MPHPSKYLLHAITSPIKLLIMHLQYHLSFLTTPLNHLDPDERATTAAATHRDSTNELIISTDYITVPSIFPPEPTPVSSPKSIDTYYASPTIYPSHILIPLYAPSTPPSCFPQYYQ